MQSRSGGMTWSVSVTPAHSATRANVYLMRHQTGRKRAADGVECVDAVGGGRIEVAANAAPAGEGGRGMPVARVRLMALGGFRAALGDYPTG